jgi:hypothetical protein
MSFLRTDHTRQAHPAEGDQDCYTELEFDLHAFPWSLLLLLCFSASLIRSIKPPLQLHLRI